MNLTNPTANFAVCATAGLTLGACSSSGKTDAAATTSSTVPSSTETTMPSAKTIVEIAASNPDFSTLVTARPARQYRERRELHRRR